MAFTGNSKLLRHRYPISIALIAFLFSCFSFYGSPVKTSGTATSTFEAHHAKLPDTPIQTHYWSNDRATEYFAEFLPGDMENDDDEPIPFGIGNAPRQHLHPNQCLFSTVKYNGSLHDCKPIPLYTLHHSWKSYLF